MELVAPGKFDRSGVVLVLLVVAAIRDAATASTATATEFVWLGFVAATLASAAAATPAATGRRLEFIRYFCAACSRARLA